MYDSSNKDNSLNKRHFCYDIFEEHQEKRNFKSRMWKYTSKKMYILFCTFNNELKF